LVFNVFKVSQYYFVWISLSIISSVFFILPYNTVFIYVFDLIVSVFKSYNDPTDTWPDKLFFSNGESCETKLKELSKYSSKLNLLYKVAIIFLSDSLKLL